MIRLAAPPERTLLRTGEVALALGISPRTALAWGAAGRLPSILTPGNHRRFPRQPVVDLAAQMQLDWALAETDPYAVANAAEEAAS